MSASYQPVGYHLPTSAGIFWIKPHPEFPDRVALWIGSQKLGSFASPQMAAEHVAGGRTGCASWDGSGDGRPAPDLTAWTLGPL